MFKTGFPWKFLIKKAAQSYGVIDPFTLLAQLRRFAQPSEVQEPIELLRAGIIFHARGLVNTKAIQHNLDWIWPYWIERQFNPQDRSFIPRSFSISHVNLTHRNWTAIGQPGLALYPIVDPRGLVTPLFDGWSVDFWIIDPLNNTALLPSKQSKVFQTLTTLPNLECHTHSQHTGFDLKTRVMIEPWPSTSDKPRLSIKIKGYARHDAWLVVSLRPYNPEGIQFIEKISYSSHLPGWIINKHNTLIFDNIPDRILYSNYHTGDVFQKIKAGEVATHKKTIVCDVGMATSAALFSLAPDKPRTIEIQIPLDKDLGGNPIHPNSRNENWSSVFQQTAALQIPDLKIQKLYQNSVSTLILLSAQDIVPGPYTYKRFWFRDACLMLNALLTIGFKQRVNQQINHFLSRQKSSGYFHSQEGEWDSNGQVLWLLDRLVSCSNNHLDHKWIHSINSAAHWIIKKRLPEKIKRLHAGLMPPGFSAEHFGPNDYYYWDNFWGLSGLFAASRLAGRFGDKIRQKQFYEIAGQYRQIVFESIDHIPDTRKRGGIPASPYRRMDSGAIGSIVADYPLQITAPGDHRIMNTIKFLMDHCFHKGAFFQDMIHSGINIYLTLSIAQTLLRAGKPAYRKIIETVADLASDTGHWPEAIHPHTNGGCMGDGQHGWAAAEWVMMIRNLFVREEPDKLVIGSGLFSQWLESDKNIHFGPTLTPFGPVTVLITLQDSELYLKVDAKFHTNPPEISIEIPGFRHQTITSTSERYKLLKKE